MKTAVCVCWWACGNWSLGRRVRDKTGEWRLASIWQYCSIFLWACSRLRAGINPLATSASVSLLPIPRTSREDEWCFTSILQHESHLDNSDLESQWRRNSGKHNSTLAKSILSETCSYCLKSDCFLADFANPLMQYVWRKKKVDIIWETAFQVAQRWRICLPV